MKIIKTFFALIIITLISGCSAGNNTNENVFQKINKKYINIPSYTALGTLTVSGNKTCNTYNFTQIYKSPNKFRMDFDDISFVSADNAVYIYDSNTKSNIDANNLKSEMYLYFINSFFKQYFMCESTKSPDIFKEKTAILECDIQHKYLSKSRLFLDLKSFTPKLMEYYDLSGKCIYKIEIKQFKFEKNIKDDLFNK